MNRITSLFTAAILAVGACSMVGCESPNQTDLPSNERGTTAGGNGAFGENPARPGDYNRSTSASGQNASNSN
jgi:hypothetical protein